MKPCQFLFLIAVVGPVVGGCTTMPYEKSDHFDGSRFHNPGSSGTKGFSSFAKWMLTREKARWPEKVEITPRALLKKSQEDQAVTQFINHATHLIQLGESNFLTDPVFSERVSPLSWAGPRRAHRPGVEFESLPPIHFAVVSHNHYDHMDAESIRRLSDHHNPLFITPLGNEPLLKSMGAKKITELDWWQSYKVENSDVVITLVPAQHWSARGVFDKNKALWGGFVLQNNKLKIYFAGDTGYGPLFSQIKDRLGPMDLSILPIGAYEPRWFMKTQHMNPEEAVKAHLDLNSRFSIGTHFGTFQLTDEGIDDPKTALAKALDERKISRSDFIAPSPGESHLITPDRL